MLLRNLKNKNVFVFCILYLGIFLTSCSSENESEKRYKNTVNELQNYLDEYNDNDYAYLGSKKTLSYLKNSGIESLDSPTITYINIHPDSIVVYWVGNNLFIKGIRVHDLISSKSFFLKLPELYKSEIKKAVQIQVDYVAKFPITLENKFSDTKNIKVELVRPNGDTSKGYIIQ